MTHPDLERELRDHYRTLDAGSPGRATARVTHTLDHVPARGWNLGRRFAPRAGLRAIGAVAAVAVLAVALLPVWHGFIVGPAASGTSPTAGTVSASPADSHTPIPGLADALVDQAGMTRSGVLWAAHGSTLSISTDHGRTWRDSSLPPSTRSLPMASVAVVDAAHAWAIVDSTFDPASSSSVATATIYRTVDGGATWQPSKVDSLEGVEGEQLYFVDARVGFAVFMTQTGPSTILRTLDGGITWTPTGSTAVLNEGIAASDANTLWAAARDGEPITGPRPLLRVSRDGGATWTNVSLPGLGDTSTIPRPSPVSDLYPGLGLYVPDNGVDNGVTFLSPTEGYVSVFEPTATTLTTRYYRTTDGGRSWSQVGEVGEQMLRAPAYVDGQHWYQPDVGDLTTIPAALRMLVTADGGRSWTAVGTGLLPGSDVVHVALPLTFWTADGQNEAALVWGDPNAPTTELALYVTWDGGKTWQPAALSSAHSPRPSPLVSAPASPASSDSPQPPASPSAAPSGSPAGSPSASPAPSAS